MKIIKEGNLQSYIIECHHCHTIIKFNETDEKAVFTPDCAWFGDCTDWSIKCPYCGESIPTRSMIDDSYFDWRKKYNGKQ